MHPDQALAALLEGNRRFAEGRATASRGGADLSRLLDAQRPIASILCCSDSRVVPEYIFDQPLGSLFVSRSPGNSVGTEALAAAEYALEHLGVRLFVVLGHTRCGAVTAAVRGAVVKGSLGILLQRIQPAVYRSIGMDASDRVTLAVEANVRVAMESMLVQSMPLREAVTSNTAQLVGMVFELETGLVRVLD